MPFIDPVYSAVWKQPVLFTAWGFVPTSGRVQWPDPNVLAGQAKQAGFGAVALQAGQYGPAVVEAVKAHGMEVIQWGLAPFVVDAAASAVIVQVEDSGQYATAVAFLNQYAGVLPIACVTTFGGCDTADLTAPLDAGCELALVECYAEIDSIHADISRMLWQAADYGWSAGLPVIGLWGESTLASYTGFDPSAGYADWLAEELSTGNWQALAKVNG